VEAVSAIEAGAIEAGAIEAGAIEAGVTGAGANGRRVISTGSMRAGAKRGTVLVVGIGPVCA
jgi:hypothetical protein